jgi:FkbM family methyltransferase
MQTETKQCRYSVMTYPPHDRYVGRSLQVYGEYSDLEVDFLRLLLRPGDLALDVGANLGAITIGMAERVGRNGVIHAFEPQRPIYEILAVNAGRWPNIVPHCAAVGAVPGSIHVPPRDYEGVGNFGGHALGGSEGETVQVITIDSLNLAQLRLMKVDVEGMELEVLRGAAQTIQRCKPALFVENDRDEKSEALISFIFSLGYRLWWHLTPLYRPDNFKRNPEDVFGNVWSVNMLGFPREVPIQLRFAEVQSPQDVARGLDGSVFRFGTG